MPTDTAETSLGTPSTYTEKSLAAGTEPVSSVLLNFSVSAASTTHELETVGTGSGTVALTTADSASLPARSLTALLLGLV